MQSLSVAIITFNEQENIERCIRSVRDLADEIVVVDSGSNDRTEAIVRDLGARFVHHPFEGHIQQKNYALSVCSHDHVLSLDADESLDDTLRESIRSVLGRWDNDAYEMNRLTNYCGAWIRHGGWYPDRKIRLFRRSAGAWTGINPHDVFALSDPAARATRLKGDILHFSYSTITDHLRQIEYFTEITAAEYASRGRSAPVWRLLLSPPVRFIRDYFLRGGFLDGFSGLVIAVLSSYAVFIKYTKLRYRTQRSSGNV